MSDETNTEPTTTQGDPEALGDAGKRALDAERNARSAAEKRVRELETALEQATASHGAEIESLRSEIATATAASAESQKAAEAAALDTLRYRVGLRSGLPEQVIDRLRGSDETELTADAASFAQVLSKSGTSVSPDPSQGARGSSGSESNADKFGAFIESRL